ncbi:MAG: MBL fold metallo-hydrolase [Promethearchaeota archaeon]|nr:MAG: MBL fold metallo-hydrolase [Candidatus Lokiarchaeota archaeon]
MVTQINQYEEGNILEWKWASDNELIPSPFFTSCYFIDGILIDSGAPASVTEFRNYVKSLIKKQEIKECIITHSHEDHSGGAHMLQNEFKIPIYADEKVIAFFREESKYPDYRQLAWGEKRKPFIAQKVSNKVISLKKNYTFDIFSMPGHAPELIALIEKSQEWAFVSDAVQPRYKMIFGNNSDIQENVSLIFKSMVNLLDYTKDFADLKLFISGQGVYSRSLIEQKIEEITNLHLKVHNLYSKYLKEYDEESKIFRKILKDIFRRETAIGKLTKGDLSVMNLIKSLYEWDL